MGFLDYFSSRKRFERKLKKIYKTDILNASRDVIDNKMILGLVVFRTISETYNRIKMSHDMYISSHLGRKEYDDINENVFNIIGHSYISNWHQLKNGNSRYLSDDDRFAEEYEPDF